jgi:hypothetical protein
MTIGAGRLPYNPAKESAVKAFWSLVALVAVVALTDGCKRRETKPAPQVVGTTAAITRLLQLRQLGL